MKKEKFIVEAVLHLCANSMVRITHPEYDAPLVVDTAERIANELERRYPRIFNKKQTKSQTKKK